MKLKNLVTLFALAAAPFALAHEGKGEHKHEGKGKGDACCHKTEACPLKEAGVDDATIAKVKAAHEAAQQDPAVVQAKEAVKKSMQDLKAAHKAAMLKADPSIADALAKGEKACADKCKDGKCDKEGKECKKCDKAEKKAEKKADAAK